MIHTNRIVTVGEQESIIDRPIVLYRGDREVEIEFTLVGNEFTFSEDGNVIKSVNASHGQLVLNTPSGEHMFSELAECHEGKVVFVVTKEMIDEFVEVGFYSFQIRLYDSAEMKSRVTIPPVLNGFDIRNPIAAEDETNVVDQGIVDYARIFKDQSNEELPTFDWTGAYNKTEWAHHDVITENKLNKIEDALYSINANVKESDVVMLNTLDKVKKDADKYVKEHMAEVEQDVEEFERNLNTDVQQFKIDTNAAMTAHKNEVSEELESFSTQLAHNTSKLNGMTFANIKDFGAIGDGVFDNTEIIQNCIDNYTTIVIPEGEFRLTKPIYFKRGRTLFGYSKSSKLLFDSDEDGIYMAIQSSLRNLSINVCKEYSSNLINIVGWELDGSRNSLDISIENIDIKKYNEEKATDRGNSCFYIAADNKTGVNIFYNLNINSINVDGLWDNGIVYCLIHNNATTTKPYITDCLHEKIFFQGARNVINLKCADNTTSQNLDRTLFGSFQNLIFNKVNAQFNYNYSSRYCIVEGGNRLLFDNCTTWDYHNSSNKPFLIVDDKTTISITNFGEIYNCKDVIEKKNSTNSLEKDIETHILQFTSIAGNSNYIIPMNCESFKEEAILETNIFKKPNMKPCYFLHPYGGVKDPLYNFLGFKFSTNNEFSNDGSASFLLGGTSGGRLVFKVKYSGNWKQWERVLTEGYFPNGSTANRPIKGTDNISIGYMYFDQNLGKPIWWDGTKWVDANGENV